MKTYAEWRAAVQTTYNQLRAVDIYLNESGKERMNVMRTLLDLASFCKSPAELLVWIEDRKDLAKCEEQLMSSRHASLPIRRLRDISQGSEEDAQ